MNTHGPAYIEARDGERLATQMTRIRDFMLEQTRPMTRPEIALGLQGRHLGRRFPGPSISAQLRHLERPENGGYLKTKDYIGNGLYVYSLRAPVRTQHQAQLPFAETQHAVA